MNRLPGPSRIANDRFRWALYGLVVGVVLGLVGGWMFHSVIGVFMKVLIVVVLSIPFILAVNFWLKAQRPPDRADTIEDADWRAGPSTRSRSDRWER